MAPPPRSRSAGIAAWDIKRGLDVDRELELQAVRLEIEHRTVAHEPAGDVHHDVETPEALSSDGHRPTGRVRRGQITRRGMDRETLPREFLRPVGQAGGVHVRD